MPRYELDGETWEIVQEAQLLHLDASGKQTTRKFVSPDHAAVQYTKLIAEKETAGWKQVAGGAGRAGGARPSWIAARSDEPRELELEQHIIDSLDDPDGYSVYADWYQTREHPRGELIALQLAEETRGEDRRLHDAVVKHLARYKAELLGPLSRHVAPNGESPLIWRNGFIQGLVFGGDDRPAAVIRDVLNHPSGRFLSSLELHINDGGTIAEALAAITPANATLRDIEIETGADVSGIEALADLRQLRRLSLATVNALEAGELGTIARISATCEALHLRFTTDDDWEHFAPLFARDDLHIRKLSMRVPQLIDKILVAISEGPFARRVETFDFALTDPDPGMRVFLANRERFVKLREVTVSLDRLTFEVRNALVASFTVVDVREDELLEELVLDDDHYDGVQE
jgi:uncharacterized protein (TIGR02996 family)